MCPLSENPPNNHLPSEGSAPARLTVNGPLPTAELRILDGHWNVVSQGVGRLEAELPPGLYQVEARLADAKDTSFVALSAGDQKIVTINQGSVQFASAAPLSFTRTSHETHMGPAFDISRKTTYEVAGGDSRLFIFFRPVDAFREQFSQAVQGLRLQTPSGETITDFSHGTIFDQQFKFLAFSGKLPHGPYLLSWQPSGSQPRSAARYQPLWICRGCETHVFVPTRERPYLEDMYLAMTAYIGMGFDPNSEYAIASEVVLEGLQRGKNLLTPQEIHRLVDNKFANPWLGILGLHAMRLDSSPHPNIANIVLYNLRHLVGDDFPDLCALQLRPDQPAPQSFQFPPMLRAGLSLVQQHSVQYPETLPEGSLTERIFEGLLADSPWTSWRELPIPELAPEGMLRTLSEGDDFNAWLADQSVREISQALRLPPSNVKRVMQELQSGGFRGGWNVSPTISAVYTYLRGQFDFSREEPTENQTEPPPEKRVLGTLSIEE